MMHLDINVPVPIVGSYALTRGFFFSKNRRVCLDLY
uniref:Uncharacterized protein n=1 Tax=Siphoviridae sp. ctAFE3 TaxID=2827796 RepID=A0A8S5S6Z0_9CAUD|nr:MAG TPA: hypothetical protein [Siphoviridae sp. ctAFE3]